MRPKGRAIRRRASAIDNSLRRQGGKDFTLVNDPNSSGKLGWAEPLRWPVLLAIGVAMIVWCFADVQRRGRVDPERPDRHRTDFTVYTEAGAAMFDGRDPYTVTNPRGWLYLYLPLFAIIISPLHVLAPQWQVTVWFALCCAFAWGSVRELTRIVRSFETPPAPPPKPSFNPKPVVQNPGETAGGIPRFAIWAAIAVAVLPAMNNMQRGQVDLLKLYLILLGFRLCLTGRSWRAWAGGGVSLGAAIVLKVAPLLSAGFLVLLLGGRWLWQRRQADAQPFTRLASVSGGMFAGIVALLLVIPASFVGWQKNLDYIETFVVERVAKMGDGEASDPAGNSRTLRNQCLSNSVVRCGNFLSYQFLGGADDRLIDSDPAHCPPMVMDDPGVEWVTFAARMGVIALLLVAGWLTVARGDALGQATVLTLACAVTLVVSPIGRASYFTELAPAVIFVPFWLVRSGMPRAARFAAWTPVVIVWLHYCALPIAGRVGLLGLGVTYWVLTCLMLLAIGRRSEAGALDPLKEPKFVRRPHSSDVIPLRRPLAQEHA